MDAPEVEGLTGFQGTAKHELGGSGTQQNEISGGVTVGFVDGVEVLLEVGETGLEVDGGGIRVSEAGAAPNDVAVVDGAEVQQVGAGHDGRAEETAGRSHPWAAVAVLVEGGGGTEQDEGRNGGAGGPGPVVPFPRDADGAVGVGGVQSP